jgi:hypothetical protein
MRFIQRGSKEESPFTCHSEGVKRPKNLIIDKITFSRGLNLQEFGYPGTGEALAGASLATPEKSDNL